MNLKDVSDPHHKVEWLLLGQTLGLTQREMAETAGVSHGAIGHHERRHGVNILRNNGKNADEEILKDIRSVAGRVDGPLTTIKYRDIGSFSERTIQDRFGSWTAALDLAGLDSSNRGPGANMDPRLNDPEWLRRRLVDDGWTQKEVADECDCSQPTVSKRTAEAEITYPLPEEPEYEDTREPAVIAKVELAMNEAGILTSTEVTTDEFGWRADVVGNNIAIEAKGAGAERPDVRRGLGQAMSYLSDGFDYAYVAAPHRWLDEKHRALFDVTDIGLIAVSDECVVASQGGSELDTLLDGGRRSGIG